MNKQIVIGASGLIGSALLYELQKQSKSVIGTYNSKPSDGLVKLDLLSEFESIIEDFRPNVIYLPASLTYVNYCEIHEEESYLANVKAVDRLVIIANKVKAKLVFLSSDYVFDGKAVSAYREDDAPSPINIYGKHKHQAEKLVKLLSDYLIIRTSSAYGYDKNRKNFVYQLIDSNESGNKFKVFKDQVVTPTFSDDLAKTIITLVNKQIKGVFHIAGPKMLNRYDFANLICDIFSLDKNLIEPIHSENSLVNRPLYSPLRIAKIEKLLNKKMIPPIVGLELMKKLIENGREDLCNDKYML